MVRAAVLVSGGGTNLQAIIDAKRAGKIPSAELALVVASNASAYALTRAENAGIAHAVLRKEKGEAPADYGERLLTLLHENAIYMHEAQQYQVEKLDFDACKAFIRRVDVGYYTDADLNVTLSLLDKEKEEKQDGGLTALGEIRVSTLVTMFKKIKFDTHETLGFGHVRLPETEMHTTAMWWTLPDALAARFESDTLKNGMMGVANLLRIVAPLSLMCAPQDIAIVYQVKSPLTDKPTLLLYDNIPGGIGLAQKAYAMRKLLLEQALQVVRDCACRQGCPGCVGPVGEIGEDGKATAIALLEALTE